MRKAALHLAYGCGFIAGIFLSDISDAAVGATDSRWFARSWQTDDGLPNNYVTAIAQTSDGYLWVGTQAGVVRFDGVRFSKFSAGYPGGHPDQSIRALESGRDGSLWILSGRGAPLGLGPDFSRLTLPDTDGSNATRLAVVQSSDGATWTAYFNAICRWKEGAVTRYTTNEGLPSRGVFYSLVPDQAGNVWLAKGGSVGFFQQRYHQVARFNVAHIAADRTNGIWIAAGTHLFQYNTDGLSRDCGTFQPDTPRAESWALMQDHTGAVWIGTDGSGLFRYDGARFEKIETSHPYILSLAEDREGNIWAGTAGGGLDRISRSGVWLEGMDSGGGSVAAIQSICEDTNGKLWGATQNGLLVSRVDGKWTPAFTHQQLPEVVTCVAADRTGALWIGTRDIKFYRWQNNELTSWDAKKGFVSHTVVALLPASSGDLWIGEYGNPNVVQSLHAGRLQTWKLPPGTGRITGLAEDSTGNIWIGSEGGKLLRTEKDHLVEDPAAASTNHSILCVYPTPDGALWIGYDGGGLGRLKNGHFARVGMEQGLFDDRLAQTVADGDGWFWFGSSRGIFKVRREELESVMDHGGAGLSYVRYGQNEGLFSVEANSPNVAPYVSPNAFRSSDGCLWMPMRKAIAVINPRSFPDDRGPLDVLPTRVAVDGRTVAAYGPDAAENILSLQSRRSPLRLLPGHRKLEFEFTALNFSAPENVRFRHRLAGFEEDWVEGDEHDVGYSRLAAGDYRFQVEARQGGGQWSEIASALNLVVVPFFWNTWWFRLLALGFFTATVIAAVRYVSFRRLRQQLRIIEQRTALEQERSRIAKDLHDSLGADVTEIGLIAESARVDADSVETQKQKIMTLSERVRTLARSLDSVVWTVNPRNDSLDRLSSYLCDMFQELFRRSSIRSRLDVARQIPALHLTPEERSNLFLAAKEAMNNVLKHSEATEVWLRIRMDDDRFRISIEDNGRGIDSPAGERTARNGVENMRSRIEGIRGAFDLSSTPGKGTRVEFVLGFAGRNGAPASHQPVSKD